MKITDIKRQKKRADRFNIYLEGRFAFALPEIALLKEKIEIGRELSAEEMDKLKSEDESQKIMVKAFDYLSRRGHSKKELRNKLVRKFDCGEKIDKVLNRLTQLGYLDDEKFVREFIEYRLRVNPKGRILIKRELLSKGIKIDLIEKILDLVYNGDREIKELTKVFALRREKCSQDAKGERKLVSYLLRRGFLWEDIKRVKEEADYQGGI